LVDSPPDWSHIQLPVVRPGIVIAPQVSVRGVQRPPKGEFAVARVFARVGPALAVLVFSFGLTSFDGPSCTPPDNAMLGVAGVAQEERRWCWAAAGEMTMNAVHPASHVRQCDEANKAFKLTVDCCAQPRSGACRIPRGGFPQYEKFQFRADRTDAETRSLPHLTWDEVKQEIGCRGKPFAMARSFSGGDGHMLVAVGYRTIGDQHLIVAIDPEAKTQEKKVTITYEAYRDGDSFETHWVDFYNVTFVGGG
jgi:hypothetical protein